MTPRKRVDDFAGVEAQLRAIERGDGEGELSFGRGATLHVSSLSKPFFPKPGITKGALMRYYTRVAPYLLPEIEGRALVLKRYPDGVAGPMFFQQNAGEHVPDVVRVATLDTVELGAKPRIIGGDLATLLYIVLPLPPRTSYDTSAELALRLAEAVVAANPESATVERGVKARPKGSIYV